MKFFRFASLVALAAALSACGGNNGTATIGGTVSGLASGNSVGLTNNTNGNTLIYTFTTSSNTFTFSQSVSAQSAYNVTITTQPTNQTCSITNGAGTVDAGGDDITNIEVICSSQSGTAVPLQASVVGLNDGAVLVLSDVSAGTLTFTGTAAGGTITQNFPVSLLPGSVYNTTVKTQPTGETCTINSTGTGTVPTTGSPSAEAIICS